MSSTPTIAPRWGVGFTSVILNAPRFLSANDYDPISITMENNASQSMTMAFRLQTDPRLISVLEPNTTNLFYSGTLTLDRGERRGSPEVKIKFPWSGDSNMAVLNQPAGLSLWGSTGEVADGWVADIPLQIAPMPWIRFTSEKLFYVVSGIATILGIPFIRNAFKRPRRPPPRPATP
jgi:hypothetical protein